jgi:hypothetical protein
MIIGNGNIAKVLEDRDDVTFFASGVSDSSCTDESLFEREKDLLNKQDFKKHLVYFSNLGVYRWDNRYIQHKREMEKLVKQWFYSYTIVRVEVLEWAKNPTTIHNYFRRMLKDGKPITIQDTHRYLLSLEEFKYWMDLIPVGEKNEMNILGSKVHVHEIYKRVKDGEL